MTLSNQRLLTALLSAYSLDTAHATLKVVSRYETVDLISTLPWLIRAS